MKTGENFVTQKESADSWECLSKRCFVLRGCLYENHTGVFRLSREALQEVVNTEGYTKEECMLLMKD